MKHITKLALAAIVTIMGCAEYEKPSLAGRWKLVRYTYTISFRPGSNRVTVTPGQSEGCQRDLEGQFTFTPSKYDSSRGTLDIDVVITDSCADEPDVKYLTSPYFYDEETKNLLITGLYPFPFKVVILEHDRLTIFYYISIGNVSASHKYEFVRD